MKKCVCVCVLRCCAHTVEICIIYVRLLCSHIVHSKVEDTRLKWPLKEHKVLFTFLPLFRLLFSFVLLLPPSLQLQQPAVAAVYSHVNIFIAFNMWTEVLLFFLIVFNWNFQLNVTANIDFDQVLLIFSHHFVQLLIR